MNALRTFLALMTAACAAVGVACVDEDDGGGAAGAGAQGQAGSPAGGAGSGPSAGAGPGGASGAGAAGAPANGLQRVVAYDAAGPRAGVDVLVHDAAGALRSRAKTSADGGASVELVGGGSVSLAYAEIDYDRKNVATYYGLDGRGELAHFIDDDPSGPSPPAMDVRVAVSSPDPRVDHYLVWLSCAGGATPVAVDDDFQNSFYTGCGRGEPYDVLVMAFDADDAALAYGTLLGAPFQVGAEVAHAVAADKTDLVARSYATSGAPAAFSESLAAVFGDRRGARYLDVPSPPDGGASPSGRYWLPPAFFERVGVGHRVDQETESGLVRFWSYDKVFEGTPPPQLAWDAGRMATLESVTLDLTTSPARPSVALRTTPAGELGDALSVELSWAPFFEGSELLWAIVSPPARALTLRAVELPDDLQAYRPNPEAHFEFVEATLTDEIDVEGFAGFLLLRAPFEGERQLSGAQLWPQSGQRRAPRHR